MAKCRYCKKRISPRATVCPHCGDDRVVLSVGDKMDKGLDEVTKNPGQTIVYIVLLVPIMAWFAFSAWFSNELDLPLIFHFLVLLFMFVGGGMAIMWLFAQIGIELDPPEDTSSEDDP